MKKYILFVILVIIFGFWRVGLLNDAIKSVKNIPTKTKLSPSRNSTEAFNKRLYSLNNPSSLWVIVNKLRPLTPTSYAPSDLSVPSVNLRKSSGSMEMKLRKVAGAALQKMFVGAKNKNFNLALASGYRSYGLQVAVYGSEVKRFGQKVADTQSARPGYSEHQTGLAADIGPASGKCVVLSCFADTAEGKWVAKNAWKYGFVIRYPKDKQAVTGYRYEPWHLRFVGTSLAKQIHKSGETLEEFFDLSSAPTY